MPDVQTSVRQLLAPDLYSSVTPLAAKQFDELLLNLLDRSTDEQRITTEDGLQIVTLTPAQARVARHGVAIMAAGLEQAGLPVPDALAEAGLALDNASEH